MRVKLLAVLVLAVATPFAVTADGVQFQNACASSFDGSCCPKVAVCGLNGQNTSGFEYHAGACPKT